jgi:hypothetical protein
VSAHVRRHVHGWVALGGTGGQIPQTVEAFGQLSISYSSHTRSIINNNNNNNNNNKHVGVCGCTVWALACSVGL